MEGTGRGRCSLQHVARIHTTSCTVPCNPAGERRGKERPKNDGKRRGRARKSGERTITGNERGLVLACKGSAAPSLSLPPFPRLPPAISRPCRPRGRLSRPVATPETSTAPPGHGLQFQTRCKPSPPPPIIVNFTLFLPTISRPSPLLTSPRPTPDPTLPPFPSLGPPQIAVSPP